MKWINRLLKKIINKKNDMSGLMQMLEKYPKMPIKKFNISYMITKEEIIYGFGRYSVDIYLDNILAVKNYEMTKSEILDIEETIETLLFNKISVIQATYCIREKIMKKIKI